MSALSAAGSRPVGVVYMTDEAGADAKVIAVPHEKLSSMYTHVKEFQTSLDYCSHRSSTSSKTTRHWSRASG